MKFGARELVFVAVMLGLLASSYFLVFNKATEKRMAVQADIDRKQRELAELEQATSGTEDLKQKIEDLQKAIKIVEDKLPQEREIDKVLKEVWQMAEANNLEQRTIKTLQSRRANNFNEQPIEMSLAGDFEGFYVYLQQLEKLPRLTRVTKMDLTKMNERDGAMEARLTLSVFFEPDTATAAAR